MELLDNIAFRKRGQQLNFVVGHRTFLIMLPILIGMTHETGYSVVIQ